MISNKFLIICCSLILLPACAYRIATPQALPQGIQVSIAHNQARLVQSQIFLQKAVAAEIKRELAWPIQAQSVNTLLLSIGEEQIRESADNQEKISIRWRNSMNVTAEFRSPYITNGSISKSFKANTSYSSLADERNALDKASEQMAQQIRSWLETIELQQLPNAP